MKQLSGFIVLFSLWYLTCLYVGENIMPFPHHVIRAFITDFNDGIDQHLYASLKRLFIGLTLAITLGTHIGIILGLSSVFNRIATPILHAIYPIPKAALLPLFIILFGLGDLTKIILIVIIVIFPIIMNTKNAIIQIPEENFYVARSLGLKRSGIYKDIIIPAIMPSLLTSVRIGIGTSIAVLYLSESFVAAKGLGYYINLYNAVNNLKMFVAIFALSMIGTILFIGVELLEKRLCRWL